jgi:hypothetical protein
MSDLKKPISAKFDDLYLDPNNPRIAPESRVGYEDDNLIFADDVQSGLGARMLHHFGNLIAGLEDSIIAQGWQPIDSMLVWEHHKTKKHHYVVLEGNTRLVTLRRIRERLPQEREKLAKMKAGKSKYTQRELDNQAAYLAQIEAVVSATDELIVYPIDADSPEELEEKLPRLMGVRHITHAQPWPPYAENLFILHLYEKLFRERYSDGRDLGIENDLVTKVGQKVSIKERKTRQRIQAASAFSHFKRRFEDQLAEDDEFIDDDQYYFTNILENKYAAEQFRLSPDRLTLDDDMEDVLFQWAFKHPRKQGDDNQNVLRIAEDIRLWSGMKKYDDKNGTAFATRLNVEEPDDATEMKITEAEYQSHKAQISPMTTVRSLLKPFKEMDVDTLLSQASHLRPMLEELRDRSDKYLTMIDAVQGAAGRQ